MPATEHTNTLDELQLSTFLKKVGILNDFIPHFLGLLLQVQVLLACSLKCCAIIFCFKLKTLCETGGKLCLIPLLPISPSEIKSTKLEVLPKMMLDHPLFVKPHSKKMILKHSFTQQFFYIYLLV